MMEGVKRVEIPPRNFAQLSRFSLFKDILVDWIILVGAGLLLRNDQQWYVILVVWMLFGIHLHRLAVLGHDGAHFNFSKNSFFNDFVANIFIFFPLGVTVQGYRAHHFDHHRKTGAVDDPELFFKRGKSWQRPKSRSDFIRMFMLDLLGGGFKDLSRLIWSIRTNNIFANLGLLVFWGIAIVFVVKLNLYLQLGIYILSFGTTFWALFRVRGFAEHVGIEGTYRFDVGPLMKYAVFPYNTWCHYEHHKWPYVSYQHLAESRVFDRVERVKSTQELFQLFSTPPPTVL